MEGPVFLTLRKPYSAISAATVGQILHDCIVTAGLGGQGYTAKSFRPTAATRAVDNNCDPETAMHIGRWKSRSVFFEHYVSCKAPKEYTNFMLSS